MGGKSAIPTANGNMAFPITSDHIRYPDLQYRIGQDSLFILLGKT
jgi:hypothetical protein